MSAPDVTDVFFNRLLATGLTRIRSGQSMGNPNLISGSSKDGCKKHDCSVCIYHSYLLASDLLGKLEMPRFLDSHKMAGATEEQLRQAASAPVGADGVKSVNVMYNKQEDKLFCLTDAPNKEAVDKHHRDMGMTCDWITEVKTTS